MDDDIKLSKKEKDKVLERARRRYKMLSDAEQHNKLAFVENMKFAFNIEEGQWNSDDVEKRDKKKRPHLTMNKLGKFVNQVVNAEKGLPNVDEVIPVDDRADVQVAKIYNEIINEVEYRSEADEVYNLSGEHAVAGGFGYWRVLTKYAEDGFDQEIEIVPIKNPLMVSLDPRGKYGFIREVLPKEEFEEKYNKTEPIDFESYSGFDDYELWFNDNKIFISEYFEEVPTTVRLVEIQNPVTGETGILKLKGGEDLSGLVVLRERMVNAHKIMWYKITGIDILEIREWPGSIIPIVEVSGHEVHLKGKTYKLGLINDAIDGQRMYNYWLTSMTEKVALSTKSPWLLTPQMIKGFEKQWEVSHRELQPYLLFNPTGGGTPQRVIPAQVEQGELAMLNIADVSIKDILGMYEASLGQSSNERSGKAIVARNARSDLGTFTFQDNFRRAKSKTKKIIAELIPIIYDNDRVIRLIGKDTTVRVNERVLMNGVETKINDLSRGKYDIRVKSQSTPSRRQQTVDNILGAMQYAPAYAGLLIPLMMKYLDAPGSEEIAAAITQAVTQQNKQEQQQNVPVGQNLTA